MEGVLGICYGAGAGNYKGGKQERGVPFQECVHLYGFENQRLERERVLRDRRNLSTPPRSEMESRDGEEGTAVSASMQEAIRSVLLGEVEQVIVDKEIDIVMAATANRVKIWQIVLAGFFDSMLEYMTGLPMTAVCLADSVPTRQEKVSIARNFFTAVHPWMFFH